METPEIRKSRRRQEVRKQGGNLVLRTLQRPHIHKKGYCEVKEQGIHQYGGDYDHRQKACEDISKSLSLSEDQDLIVKHIRNS